MRTLDPPMSGLNDLSPRPYRPAKIVSTNTHATPAPSNRRGSPTLSAPRGCAGADACNPNPCLNGGTCDVDPAGGHTCTCNGDAFLGMQCQIPTTGELEGRTNKPPVTLRVASSPRFVGVDWAGKVGGVCTHQQTRERLASSTAAAEGIQREVHLT